MVTTTEGVDCVVVDYRTPQDLDGFIRSFLDYADIADRLHVALVDPRPDSVSIAQKWGSRLASAVSYDTNVGYAAACNHTVERIPGRRPTLAFFNADTRLTQNITSYCERQLQEHDDWAVVGPRQVNDAGQLVHAGITGSNQRCAPRAWQRPDTDPSLWVTEEVVSVSGSAYFVKTKVWDELAHCPTFHAWRFGADFPQVGAMLPTPLYYEETWVSYHARDHGYKVMYLGEICMRHRWHQAVVAAGHGEPTRKFDEARRMFRDCCDYHHIDHD